MLKQKLPQQEQGFTLVEVLIAILVATLFLTFALQGMVLAALFKARARQVSEATTWIQADIENVRNTATLPLPSTTLTTSAGSALVVASTARFEVGDQLKVGTDSTNNVIQTIVSATSTINLSAALGSTPSAGAPVEVIKSVRCGATTSSTGFGDYLNDNLPTLTTNNPSTGAQTILGKDYIITRTPNIRNVSPFDVLELTYSVAPQDTHTTLTAAASSTSTSITVASATGFKAGDTLTVGTDTDNEVQSIAGNTITLTSQLGTAQASGAVVDASIATVNTEVIPNAALQCPTN